MSQPYRLIRNSCAAFTWTGDGRCCGVLLENHSGAVSLAAHWTANVAPKATTIGEALASGKRALGMAEGCYCLAGPANGGWGMADILLPLSLKSSELRTALSFELRKRTPVPMEQLTWGYRFLPPNEAKPGMQCLRLFYARNENWRRWVESAAGLRHLDLLVAPPVVLDPLLAENDLVYPGKTCFTYVASPTGRDVIPSREEEAPKELVPFPDLDLGELSSQPEDVQRNFIPALLLALYGMGRELARDAATLPTLPEKMRPKRYVAYHSIASVLVLAIVIFLGMGMLKGLQLRRARLRLIRNDRSAVEASIQNLSRHTSGANREAAKALEAEMARYKFDAPDLSAVLLELTREITPPAWMAGSFEWNADQGDSVVPLTFTIREPAGDTANQDIGIRLNNSPILGDVAESKSTQNRAGFVERRFVLKARYDTDEEKEQLVLYKEEQAKKAARKAEAERKAAKEAEEEEKAAAAEEARQAAEAMKAAAEAAKAAVEAAKNQTNEENGNQAAEGQAVEE